MRFLSDVQIIENKFGLSQNDQAFKHNLNNICYNYKPECIRVITLSAETIFPHISFNGLVYT